MDKKLGISIESNGWDNLVFEGKNQATILKELQNEKYFDKKISIWYYNGDYWDFV
jgi:hypothetical protein